MPTVGELITSSLKKAGVLGVGNVALSEDSNDAFNDLNQMVAQWNRKRWLVYRTVDTSFVSTGAASYTVGSGGNFNITPRPARIVSAFFRMVNLAVPNQVDYPLEILNSREDYNRIQLKRLATWPSFLFYDPVVTTGIIYPWPVVPATDYEIHITTFVVIAAFTGLAQNVTLPAEYEAMIVWNLARRLRVAYQLPPDPELNGLAKDALETVRGANVSIPRLTIPQDLLGPGRYNVYSNRNG